MIAAIAAITILFGCNNTTTRKKPVLAVSIQPQKYLLEKIVGEKYTVTCLLAQGANPENYEPNAAHLMNLESCQAFFRIGHIGFELAISNRIKSKQSTFFLVLSRRGVRVHIPVVAVFQRIEMLWLTHGRQSC